MEIQVVSVSKPEANGKGNKAWEQVTVNYIGKQGPAKRVIRSFEGDVYSAVQALKEGDSADVTVVKEGNFWNWKAVSKLQSQAGVGSTAQLPLQAAKKGDWETKEERADRQHYIVRQSSISSAIDLLGQDADVNDVLRIAKEFEDFVFSGEVPEVKKPKAKAAKKDESQEME